MITKNQIKLIISLQQKKNRIKHQLFFAEGEKVIHELLKSTFKLVNIYCTEPIFNDKYSQQTDIISESDFKKISALATPNNCLAQFEIPETKPFIDSGLIMMLDNIQDPGNLGTIIRLCDWFGVDQLVCSPETVDVYNPKVVQATMGSLTRVRVRYQDLEPILAKTKLPIYGTFMDGENIYKTKLPKNAIIILGNEGKGISEKLEQLVTKKIAIPRFGKFQETESLNVANAAAIVLSEFLRGS